MTPRRRQFLTRFLRMFMREARWTLRRYRGTEIGPRGDRCRNCAFQPGTDSAKGFESTAFSLLNALNDSKPFFCHSGMAKGPDGQFLVIPGAQLRPCAGWLAIAEVGPAAAANVQAMGLRASARAGEMPA